MKFAKLLLRMILVPITIFAQSHNWEWVSPCPTGNQIYQVYFLNEHNGWIAGSSGLIYHTTDGGVNWQDESINSNQILLRAI